MPRRGALTHRVSAVTPTCLLLPDCTKCPGTAFRIAFGFIAAYSGTARDLLAMFVDSALADHMRRSLFDIPKMDCPSEERIVRLALHDLRGIALLTFDIPARRLTVDHEGDERKVLRALEPLGFGASLLESAPIKQSQETTQAERDLQLTAAKAEGPILKTLLVINAFMFFAELFVGWIANSTGLIADSLDMFADASIYGISLYAVGRGSGSQKRAASLSGRIQILLAAVALFDVARRTVFGSEPVAPIMIGMASLALLANVTCLALLFKHRHGGLHMKASWIFSANDVIANGGVILAGVLVALVGKPWPDLVVGIAIAVLVFRGGARILRMTKEPSFVPDS